MRDLLPFPMLRSTTPERQIEELVIYLVQLKEELEFILSNISEDNLSETLRKRLEGLGVSIGASNKNRKDELLQVTSRLISVRDVVGSDVFKEAVKNIINEG
ncbi:MAG: hypothetical protein UHM23_05930 [Clostridia bacterium]|nr:hypothetical protein [Clostridia bacterium]